MSKLAVVVCLVLAACVAPEEPTVRYRPAPPKATASNVGMEDAPTPNRKIGAPTSDAIIKMAR